MLPLAQLLPKSAPLVSNAIHVHLELSQLPFALLLIYLDLRLDLSSTSDSPFWTP